jgi:sporulation protein YlmC with PRC-barrel domain
LKNNRKVYKEFLFVNIMAIERKPLREILNKNVVTKEGRRLGAVKDITFETRTGELIHLILTTPTAYANSLGLEKTKEGDILVPYSSIIAVGDFVVVSEEDLA